MPMGTVFSSESLSQLRTVGDATFSNLLAKVDKNLIKEIWSLRDDADLLRSSFQGSLQDLVDYSCTLPDWRDSELLKLSSDFFQDNQMDIMMMLGLVSLPYCYGGADGAKVLVASQRILNNTNNRLRETGTFVWDVCAPGAFSGNGKGLLACLKVRLIHQFTRDKLLSDDWDMMQYGYPINQVDQAGTNMSFSLIAIRAMRKTGLDISNKEAEAYIHRWNVVSHLLGLDSQLIKHTLREVSLLSRTIEKYQFRKSQEGEMLTNALLNNIYGHPGFKESQKRILAPYMGFLIGEPIAGHIGLNPSLAARNAFEATTLLKRLKEILPWVPLPGMINNQPSDSLDLETMLAEIPLLR